MNIDDLRADILAYLTDNHYAPEVDDIQINIICEAFESIAICKVDIEENGLLQQMTGRNGVAYTKMNPAYGVKQMCIRDVQQACSKLGINRADRLKLKLDLTKHQSDIDKLKNMYDK